MNHAQPTKPRRPRIARRTTVNIMLYIGVLAMAALVYYDHKARTGEEPAINAFAADEISLVGVHRPGHQTITLKKEPAGTWTITAPFTRAAQTSRVEALLAIAELDTEASYAVTELDIGELGLGAPQATLNLSTAEGTIHVQLGGKGPNNQRRYLQVDQNVWLVDDVFLPLINGGVNAFVDLSLFAQNQQLAAIHSDLLNSSDIELLTVWQAATAAGVTIASTAESKQAIDITFTSGETQTLRARRDGNQISLQAIDADYAFLLTDTQAIALGLDTGKLSN